MSAEREGYAAALALTGIRTEDLADPVYVRAVVALLQYLGYAVIAPGELDRLHGRLVDALSAGNGHPAVMAWARVGGSLQAFVERTPGRQGFGEPPAPDAAPLVGQLVAQAAADVEQALGHPGGDPG